MNRNRNRNKDKLLDPVRINNYNKFLATLDKNKCNTYKPCKSFKSKQLNTQDNKEEPNLLKDDSKLVEQIDLFIDQLINNFRIIDYNSCCFTGQTPNDILMSNIEINDPNIYENETIRKAKKILNPTKKECKFEIKENINIDTQINNISDILKLVETYKLDPTIKYNINMKSLHIIKSDLEELNNMIGMKELKKNIVDQIIYFIQGLHKNNNGSGDFMHTVIYGPPGTGKTDIAKIMGRIYSKIGILNKGTFKKVTRSDLIAGYLGQTALKTRDVIKESLGGVLFIDEAYSLGSSEKRDSFSKECIDTLCEALSDNKENLMVIIAGYENELKECFFNYNQGLDSRFSWRFKTDEYSGEDLYNIFLKKVRDIGWEISENTKITSDWFNKNKEYFKFFGRDIETILAKTKITHSKRVFCRPDDEKKKITIEDLENGFQLYLKNDNVKSRKDEEYLKRELYNTLYS